jgi:hypothetical protein
LQLEKLGALFLGQYAHLSYATFEAQNKLGKKVK